MENNIDMMLHKYSDDVIKNINIDNVNKILDYLFEIKCPIINDIVENYFDVFIIEYDVFFNRIEKLNKKYDNEYFNKASENLDYLEELFLDN